MVEWENVNTDGECNLNVWLRRQGERRKREPSVDS